MTVPKKRISSSKKRIRKNIWKGKGHWAALKAFSLGKSLSTGNSKTFFCFFSMPADFFSRPTGFFSRPTSNKKKKES
uniref:Large ribosomal subunit protein bL32c n=8 Tax=Pelargonium TaxID=4030 RepID=A0A1B0PS28_9ROSI|nr:ribosomal protein L32 [Pelargonium exhibens]YP_009299168.1 ribosomal protein L32 [Pelargonium exhibens]YP_009299641.1 ribosomal protein L32 [Pelargonium myrrhifolium]YP_009299655.1 ribosomal protein L32 [Pelargonium myrrhifolium]AJB99068.1 ribosomal protein L32 [Pelargonium exhibens]AJB99082.1 ribosomal protein L32 [Pelargonium exhibens]AJB99555.1 ribosomal protein L32 [Pelargonium myrrhifolium]AJB99569.1 ribosomal protein L32 [Pelargonium myrrhifolium]